MDCYLAYLNEKKLARDDFSKDVISKLRERVGTRCSNPECGVPTLGPQAGSDKVASIGVAAHIHAASPGGPRFLTEMTPKQRGSFDNGIWLCQSCSVEIDHDPEAYSPAVLTKWKQVAEGKAARDRGRKLPSENDAIDTLVTAMTGQSKRIIPSMISHLHEASSKALEALDPRFRVSTSYENNSTLFGIHAKEDVPVELVITTNYAPEYLDKFGELIATGKDLVIDTRAASFTGSKLLEEISSEFAQGGKLTISSTKRDCILKMWIKPSNGNEIVAFDDAIGKLSNGIQGLNFKGTAYGGMLSFELEQNFVSSGPGGFKFALDIDKWDKRDLKDLPYFNPLKKWISLLADGGILQCGLEFEGNRLLTSTSIKLDELDPIKSLNYQFDFLHAARSIAVSTKSSIYFQIGCSFDIERFNEALNTAQMLESGITFTKENFISNPKCTLISAKELDLDTDTPRTIVHKDPGPHEIDVFGVAVPLPPISLTFHNVMTKTISRKPKDDTYDEVEIEFIPCEGFRVRKAYEDIAIEEYEWKEVE